MAIKVIVCQTLHSEISKNETSEILTHRTHRTRRTRRTHRTARTAHTARLHSTHRFQGAFGAFSEPCWGIPKKSPKTVTKKAPRAPFWDIFRAWLKGTPRRASNCHEKGCQGAILEHFQSLAAGEPRKSPKLSRKRLPGSHF
jgi:hypothetical protein